MTTDIERWQPPNDPSAFESLCLDLWREIWQDPSAQKNGRSGQPQAGVDVFGQPQGKWAGVQSKQKDGLLRSKVTIKELEAEVEAAKEFKPPGANPTLADQRHKDRVRSINALYSNLAVIVVAGLLLAFSIGYLVGVRAMGVCGYADSQSSRVPPPLRLLTGGTILIPGRVFPSLWSSGLDGAPLDQESPLGLSCSARKRDALLPGKVHRL